MKIRQKPSKPERLKIRHEIELYEMSAKTLLDLLVQLESDGVDLSQAICEYEGLDDRTYEINYHLDETEEAFSVRQAEYEEELATYNKWYEQNKEAIIAHSRAVNQKKEAEKQVKLLQKHCEDLEKELIAVRTKKKK